MDEPARRYLLLGLRLNRLRPGYLAAYAGPPELAEAVAGEPQPLAVELHDEALGLAELATSAPEPRASWLRAQLRAMGAAARVLAGEEIAYPELVEELLDVTAEPEPEQAFATAHRLLDDALPPGGSLAERLAAHRQATRLPSAAVVPVLERALGLLRRRALEDLGLPAGEQLRLTEAGGLPQPARLSVDDRSRSILELNPAAGWTAAQLYQLAARLGYPGGHAEWVSKAARGGEMLARCEPTPATTVSAAISSLGREVLLTDAELEAELASVARRNGGRPQLGRESAVRRAEQLLAAVPANVALSVLRDGLPRAEAGDYLREVGLLEARQAESEIARLASPIGSVNAFAVPGAVRLAREWLEVTGQTAGMRRLVAEPLSPAALRVGVPR